MGVIARSATTKQSQSEIGTPFGLAMTIPGRPHLNYFMLSVIKYLFLNDRVYSNCFLCY